MSDDSKSPNESQPEQMALWSDDQSSGEIEVQPDFDASIRRVDQDGETLYSLVDVCAHFSDTSQDARKYWNDTKARLEADGFELSEKIRQLKLEAKDGKKRATDCANAETVLRIVQSIPSPKAEPIRQWFARIAVERMQEAANPELGVERAKERARKVYQKLGKENEWINTRLDGMIDRKAFAAAIVERVPELHVGSATNAVYRDLFDRDAKQLRKDLDLPKGNIRDHMYRVGLNMVSLAESATSALIEKTVGNRDYLTPQEAITIIHMVSEPLGIQAEQLSNLLGLDIATGKPLLSSGQ